MKKTMFRFYKTTFCKTLVLALLTGFISTLDVSAKSFAPGYNSLTAVEPAPNKLSVYSYIMQNSQVMRVQFENPTHERVNIQILNIHKQVVYEAYQGKQEAFIGKYNLEEIPDGDYTLVVQSPSYTYSRSFSIKTSLSRVVKLQNDVLETEVQEAL